MGLVPSLLSNFSLNSREINIVILISGPSWTTSEQPRSKAVPPTLEGQPRVRPILKKCGRGRIFILIFLKLVVDEGLRRNIEKKPLGCEHKRIGFYLQTWQSFKGHNILQEM
jgi:hypothetical protein